MACVGSVTDPAFAERFIGTAVNQYKGLDIIVNNAGYTWDNVIQKMTDEQWDAMLDVPPDGAVSHPARGAADSSATLGKAEAEAGRESSARSSTSRRSRGSSAMPDRSTTPPPRPASSA